MIQFLYREQIDVSRWDDVISQSPMESIYPYAWYLDAAGEKKWSALVMDDYRYVMPIIWKRKYGIRYIYHPNFVQQLGVFGADSADPYITRKFIEAIPSGFKYGQYRFNTQNLVGEEKGYSLSDRVNYELDLSSGYESIGHRYSKNTTRNIKKFEGDRTQGLEPVSFEELLELKVRTDISNRRPAYLQWIRHVFSTITAQAEVQITGCRRKNELLAAAIFVFSRTRAMYLLSVSSEAGKESRAMFGIIDHFIRQHAASPLVLDFEGSQVQSIARFFSGFGADPRIYQSIAFSRFPVSLFKSMTNG